MRIAVVFILCFLPCLLADQIALKNGDRVTGKILNTDDKTITVKTDLMGEIKIDKAAVVSVRSDAPLNVTLADGKKVQGAVDTVQNEVRVVKEGQTLATAPLADVKAYRDDAAQRAWEREQLRLTNPPLDDFWAGSVNFALANASGNSRTTTLSTSASVARAVAKNKTGLYFNQIYAKQSTTASSGPTANRISGGAHQDRDLSNRLFVFGTADFDYDRLLDLDLRSVLGGGLGYHAWKGKKGYFDAGFGGAWNREKFSDGLIRKSGELLAYEELGYQPLSRLKLFERFTFYPNLTETGEYRYAFDANATVPITKWLQWTFGVNNRYMSNPPIGRRTRDLLVTTGIGVTFDQTKR